MIWEAVVDDFGSFNVVEQRSFNVVELFNLVDWIQSRTGLDPKDRTLDPFRFLNVGSGS